MYTEQSLNRRIMLHRGSCALNSFLSSKIMQKIPSYKRKYSFGPCSSVGKESLASILDGRSEWCNRKSPCVGTCLFHLRILPLRQPASPPWETIGIPWHIRVRTKGHINLQKDGGKERKALPRALARLNVLSSHEVPTFLPVVLRRRTPLCVVAN